MPGLPFDDRADLPPEQRRALAATFGAFTTLGALLDWGRRADPPVSVETIVVQDEYSHDVLIPLPAGRYLVYEAT